MQQIGTVASAVQGPRCRWMMSVDDDDWLNEKRSEGQRQRTALLTESRRRLQRAVDDQQFADVTHPLDTQALHPPRRRDVTARVTSRRRADVTRPLDTQALQPPRRRDDTAAAANQRVSVGRALKPGVVR